MTLTCANAGLNLNLSFALCTPHSLYVRLTCQHLQGCSEQIALERQDLPRTYLAHHVRGKRYGYDYYHLPALGTLQALCCYAGTIDLQRMPRFCKATASLWQIM